MRDARKLTENMPPRLADFYRQHIATVRQGIRSYFPEEIDAQFLARVTGQEDLFPQDLGALYDSVMLPTREYLNRGGKVLRPILCALTLEAYGQDPAQHAAFLGAIEVMEDSSIMMDDYIDNSLLRRGGPCAHVAHGFPLANISSCTAFALSHYLFFNNEMNLPPAKAARLLNAIAWEHIQMAFGQIEELYWTADNINSVTVSQYLQETIARCAFLSFRGPLRYAGILADAPEEDIPVLERIGDYLLIGYHIRGDDLDLSPDSDAWGKVAGEDITTGRRTLLINCVLGRAEPADRERLETILNSRTRDDALKTEVFELVRKYKGLDYTQRLAREYHDRTRREIDKLHVPESHRELFREFSEFAGSRRRL